MNKVLLAGNLGKDPELLYTSNGTCVTKFSLATKERRKVGDAWEDYTEWHTVKSFGKTAEVFGTKLRRGSGMLVEGKLCTRKFEKDGVIKYYTEVVADRLEFAPSSGKQERQEYKPSGAVVGTTLPNDDDVPF